MEPVSKNSPSKISQLSYFNGHSQRIMKLLCLAILLSSCSYNMAPTTAQREQKKFERFKIAPKEVMIYSGSAFLGYGIGKHFANFKLKD